jgi:hypothetical protein
VKLKPLQSKYFGFRRGAASLGSGALVCEQHKQAATKYQGKKRSFAKVSSCAG